MLERKSGVGAILIVLMLVGGFMPMAHAAQAASHVLLGKVQVSWNAPWTQDMDSGGVGSTWEQLWIDAPSASLMVEVDVPAVSGQQLRDNFLTAFANEVPLQQIDQGSYGAMTYSVDLIPYPNAPVGAFTLIREAPDHTLMVLIIASASTFATAIADVQAGVTVDGVPLLQGVDGAVMQQRLLGASGQADAAPQIPTPTPQTGLIPNIPVANAVPVRPADAQDVPAAGPVTFPASNTVVNWSAPWSPQRASESSLRLWNAEARVLVEVWTTPYIFAPESAAQFAQSDLVTGSGWTVEAAVDLVPGSRLALVMSRSVGSGMLYQYAEVTVEPSHLVVVSTTGWGGTVAAALPSVPTGVTIGNQPALTNVAPAGLPPAQQADPASHRLFDSGRTVVWTGHWSEAILQISGVRLVGPEGMPLYRMWDVLDVEPLPAAAQAESILAGAPQGSTVYRTIDAVPGSRAIVVLQQSTEAGVRYHIFDVQYVGSGATNQYITATDAGFGGQIATIQANVTVDGQPVFTDLQTFVPELFGG